MKRVCGFALLAAATAGAAQGTSAGQHKTPVVFYPRLTKGRVLRYQFTLHMTAKRSTASVIVDPIPAVSSEVSLSIAMRLEVLDAQSGPGGAETRPVARLRATYERAAATQRSDDPASDDSAAAKRLAKLEGKTFECMLSASGAGACTGDEADAPGATENLRGLLKQIFAAASLPQKGIVPGETWGDEEDAGGEIPLAGLRWVRQFRYVSDEPCEAGTATAGVSRPAETCAVIRTRSLLVRKDERKDPTPDAFREKGLRAAGTARGANESLARISLASGLVVSTVESGWQATDVTVSTADGERKIRTTTDVKTDSGLTLVRDNL